MKKQALAGRVGGAKRKSDISALPMSETEVEIRRQQDEVIDMIGGPAKGDVGVQPESQRTDIEHVDGGGKGDDDHGGAGIAHAGDAELVDDGRSADDERRKHDPQRPDRSGDQFGVVGIDAQHVGGEDSSEQNHGQHEQIT